MYIEQHSRYQNKANNIQLRYDDKQFHTTVIEDVLLWIEHNLISLYCLMMWRIKRVIPSGIFSGCSKK